MRCTFFIPPTPFCKEVKSNKMTIALTEDSTKPPISASAKENRNATEIAKILGFKVYYIPPDFQVCENAENALYHIAIQERETPGIWIGYIPTQERYQAIYQAALGKRIKLLNTPEQHLTVQEFDRAYPKLLGLTPESMTITSLQECEDVVVRLGLPLFVKGTLLSRKSKGWKACVAETLAELQGLTQELLALENRSRGRVIARKLVKFRHSRYSPDGFPLGREYRVFIYCQKVLGYGYYWEGDDCLKKLSAREEAQVLELAIAATKRLKVPYLAVDIGQLENGEWVVIETGDAQFCGISQIPLLPLWSEILKVVEGENIILD